MSTASMSGHVHDALRQELLRLAHREEDLAAHEAEGLSYWQTTPISVAVHRRCACALRAAAEELVAAPPQVRS